MPIRDYAPPDHPACLALFDANVPDFFHPDERSGYAAFLDRLPGPYLVVEEAERIVAAGGWAVRPGSGTADLCWCIVVPDRQREGLGFGLFEARLGRIRKDPRVERIALVTSRRTRAFYERLGFRTLRVERDGHAPGIDRIEMERPV